MNKKDYRNQSPIASKHIYNSYGIAIYAFNEDCVIYACGDDLKIRKAKLYYDSKGNYYFYDFAKRKHYLDEFIRCKW